MERLSTIVCLPCDQMPANERKIVVKASDGERSQLVEFGRHTSMSTIMFRLPILFMDRAYDERRSKRRNGRAKAL